MTDGAKGRRVASQEEDFRFTARDQMDQAVDHTRLVEGIALVFQHDGNWVCLGVDGLSEIGCLVSKQLVRHGQCDDDVRTEPRGVEKRSLDVVSRAAEATVGQSPWEIHDVVLVPNPPGRESVLGSLAMVPGVGVVVDQEVGGQTVTAGWSTAASARWRGLRFCRR